MRDGAGGGRVPSGVGRGWPRTWLEVRLLIHVAGLLLFSRLLLACVKLKTLVRWLDSAPSFGRIDPATLEKAARYTDALLARFPYTPHGNCLPRSMVLFRCARRAGLPARLHCGVRRIGPRIQGHAWLSLYGEPLLEASNPEESYVVTFSYPDTDEAASGEPLTEPVLRSEAR